MDKVYLSTEFSLRLFRLIKQSRIEYALENDYWVMSQNDWIVKIKPWFDENKTHYDLGKINSIGIVEKDVSQKYPITTIKLNGDFYIGGGIEHRCKEFLNIHGRFDPLSNFYILKQSDYNMFMTFCSSSRLGVVSEKSCSSSVHVWQEDDSIFIKGEIDFELFARCMEDPWRYTADNGLIRIDYSDFDRLSKYLDIKRIINH